MAHLTQGNESAVGTVRYSNTTVRAEVCMISCLIAPEGSTLRRQEEHSLAFLQDQNPNVAPAAFLRDLPSRVHGWSISSASEQLEAHGFSSIYSECQNLYMTIIKLLYTIADSDLGKCCL